MSKKLNPQSGIKEHAVIVITLMENKVLSISSENNGRSITSKMADAIIEMAGTVIETRLEEFTRAADADGWISVKDQLPPTNNIVLWSRNDDWCCLGCISTSDPSLWVAYPDPKLTFPLAMFTHWQVLPGSPNRAALAAGATEGETQDEGGTR